MQGDAAALPWPDEAFTKVACVGQYGVHDRSAAALTEMHRVLRPGGRAAVTMGYRDAEQATPGERNAWGLPIWGDEPAREMIRDAGFDDVTVTFVDCSGDDARLVIGTKH